MNLSLPLLPVIISLIVLSLIIGYTVFFKKVFDSEKKFESEEKKALHSYRKIILQAHKDAEDILLKAQELSVELREETVKSNLKIAENTENEAKAMMGALLSDYKRQTEILYGQMQSNTREMFNRIAAEANKNIQSVLQNFSDKTVNADQFFLKQAGLALKKYEDDLEKYKQVKVVEISEKADKLVSKISAEILEKSLTPLDHEKLILAALDKAKKEEIISFERL